MSITPRIIRETNSGFQAFDIRDRMLANRQVICVDPIDAQSANSLVIQLLHLQNDDPEGEITLILNTPGGEVLSGLAVYDTMQAISCPIRTLCTGIAASMGAVLFAAGDRRQMLPHSKVMIHDPLMNSVGGNALSVKDTAENLMKMRNIMGEILAKHTDRSVKEVLKKTSSDTFFDAQQAIDFGLADEIITNL